jgi:hypothetical protein
MRKIKYIKIPTDFFEREPIRSLRDLPEGDTLTLLYIEMLLESYQEGGKGTITICDIDLTDDVINALFRSRYSDIGAKLRVLEEHGLLVRNLTSIQVFKCWVSKHDRNSDNYKQWRKGVFVRDGFKCQHCGTSKDIQAHHIKSWTSCEELRYDIENGITLCRSCHLKAHGGCWKNG